MRVSIVIVLALSLMSAGSVLADGPGNFGEKGNAWKEYELKDGTTFYQNTENPGQIKKWDSPGGKWFTQPGNAEDNANGNSVIPNDPIHPGTQVLPGSNR